MQGNSPGVTDSDAAGHGNRRALAGMSNAEEQDVKGMS